MPLVRCPDCGRDVSTEAPACLGCGRPMKREASLAAAPPVINCPPVIGDQPITVDEPRQTFRSPSSNRKLMVWVIVIGAALALIASWPKGSAPQPVSRPSGTRQHHRQCRRNGSGRRCRRGGEYGPKGSGSSQGGRRRTESMERSRRGAGPSGRQVHMEEGWIRYCRHLEHHDSQPQ